MPILTAVVYLLLVCGAAALVYWAVDRLGTPDPLNRVVKTVAIIVGIVLVVWILLALLGMAGGLPPLA